MTRGEVWIAKVGNKSRPVLILTRPEVIDVRLSVTVAEITSSVRGLAVEIPLDNDNGGFDEPSVVNCDGLHTITQASLTSRIGQVNASVMNEVCSAVAYAIDC